MALGFVFGGGTLLLAAASRLRGGERLRLFGSGVRLRGRFLGMRTEGLERGRLPPSRVFFFVASAMLKIISFRSKSLLLLLEGYPS